MANRNYWKTAFWLCLALFMGSLLLASYTIIDQGVMQTYMQEGYYDTEADLETLIDLINKTSLSKSEIRAELKNHRLFEFMSFDTDTVSLERVMLFFSDDQLVGVESQW